MTLCPEEIGEKMGLTAERVREIQKNQPGARLLETPIGEEEDSQLGDFIEDDAAIVPLPTRGETSMLQGAALQGARWLGRTRT